MYTSMNVYYTLIKFFKYFYWNKYLGTNLAKYTEGIYVLNMTKHWWQKSKITYIKRQAGLDWKIKHYKNAFDAFWAL